MSNQTNVQRVLDSAQNVRALNDRSDLTYSETLRIGDYAHDKTDYRYVPHEKSTKKQNKTLTVLASVTVVLVLATLALRLR